MAQKPSSTVYKPDLQETSRLWRRLLYSKIENIFVYENLPAEIPLRFFNLCLFKRGRIVFYKIGDKYAVQPFSYNNLLNWYYVPKRGRVVNPYLPQEHQNWEFDIDEEAVIYNSSPDIYNYRNNSLVSDLIFKTANQLAENDISYYCIQRNSRLIAMFTAETDLQKREMDKIISKMYNGETDITMAESLVSHVHANPLSQNSTRNSITELIEFQQYVLANFYHSFGINSNYNLKREQLNSDEINVNQEVLRLNIEDMLQVRKDGVEKINKKYGLNITVELNEKLYATLLRQTEMFQNGTIDPETGLIDTYGTGGYVDTDMFQNGTESIKEEINKKYGLRNVERNEENGTGNKTDEESNTSEKDRDEDRRNNNDNGGERPAPGSDSKSKRPDRSDEREAGRDIQNDKTDTDRGTSDRGNEDENSGNSEQRPAEENDSSGEEHERDSKSDEQSDTVDDNSDSKSSDAGTDDNSGSSSGITINVNITQADGVEISADNPEVTVDETSQNGTDEEEGE